MRNDRKMIFLLNGSCNSDGAWAAAHTLTLQQTVLQFLIHIFRMVGRDIDVFRTELLQLVYRVEEFLCAHALQRGQHFERETLLVVIPV